MNKNHMFWERLRLYLPEDMEEYVLKLFDSCFDYSSPRPWDHVIAELVTILHCELRFLKKTQRLHQLK